MRKCHKTSIKNTSGKQNKTQELPKNPTEAAEKRLEVPRVAQSDAKDYPGMDLDEITMVLISP